MSFNSAVRICFQGFSIMSSCNHRNTFPSLSSKCNMKKRKINSANFRFVVQVNVGCWKQLFLLKSNNSDATCCELRDSHGIYEWLHPLQFFLYSHWAQIQCQLVPCVGVWGSAGIVWACLISHLWQFEQGRCIIIDASSEEELQNLHQTQAFKPLTHFTSNPLRTGRECVISMSKHVQEHT